LDWKNDPHVLVLKEPQAPAAPNWEDYVKSKDLGKANFDHQTRNRRSERAYWLNFNEDGSFRIDDVPAGAYELRIKVTEALKNGEDRLPAIMRSAKEIASLTQEVVVPEMPNGRSDEPLDLGTLQLKWKAPQARQPSVTLSARTLDGKAFSLESFRGKYVLLNFWTGWSKASAEQLAELKKLSADLQGNPRVAFVGINLGDKPEEVQEKVKSEGYPWQQAVLSGRALAETTEKFGVDSLPAAFLINPEGQIIARDLKGERLQQTVKSALNRR
jgi:hypothetical protein